MQGLKHTCEPSTPQMRNNKLPKEESKHEHTEKSKKEESKDPKEEFKHKCQENIGLLGGIYHAKEE